jgi:hypothetical protein
MLNLQRILKHRVALVENLFIFHTGGGAGYKLCGRLWNVLTWVSAHDDLYALSKTNKQTPWFESTSELYRPSDRCVVKICVKINNSCKYGQMLPWHQIHQRCHWDTNDGAILAAFKNSYWTTLVKRQDWLDTQNFAGRMGLSHKGAELNRSSRSLFYDDDDMEVLFHS